jgi:transcriptional regulator GlxA family with amidase domain
MSAWLRVSGDELVDRAYGMDQVPLALDPTLAEQLAEAREPAARLALLRRHLAAVPQRGWVDPRIGAAVDLALADGRASPAAIAAAVGVSPRQLGRLFRERLGFGPKPLARLGRFQRVLRALEAPGRHTLAAVAAQAGYFDQAHLGRDFRLFAGVSPARYLREVRELTRNFIADETPV